MTEETECPICGKDGTPGGWLESKADDSDEFRTWVHEKDGMFVTESCMETR